ncbi:NAD+ synthase [Haloterrigena sp. H1]|uniref:NAD+ synthase n=1 Tax=Haloterrigena sp. H1 TaxID=2552943 RepID=UPI00110D2CC1|nr:NAD+ synthase [Haloterrigena sp. H1]TMT87798.1 NAD+ synthase [Haloterrigena sp. H1]
MGADSKTYVYQSIERTNGPFLTDRQSLERIRERIVADIRATVADANAEGVVVAMSGGIDSTLTAALAVEAVGSDNVLGLGLPCHMTDQAHVSDAHTIADGMGIDFQEFQLRPLLECFEETVASDLEPEEDADDRPNERNHELGNATARLRMLTAYYAANRQSRIVLGTANRSERLLGYFTKHGDGAADVHPIGDCYKTEVRALAKHIGLPRRIVTKEPTAGFWATQTDADELGARYDVIDPLLYRFVEEGCSLEEAVAGLRIDRETAAEIVSRYAEAAHKRTVPPTAEIAGRGEAASRFD